MILSLPPFFQQAPVPAPCPQAPHVDCLKDRPESVSQNNLSSISTKNAKKGQKQDFYRVIRETLEKLVAEGIDRISFSK